MYIFVISVEVILEIATHVLRFLIQQGVSRTIAFILIFTHRKTLNKIPNHLTYADNDDPFVHNSLHIFILFTFILYTEHVLGQL